MAHGFKGFSLCMVDWLQVRKTWQKGLEKDRYLPHGARSRKTKKGETREINILLGCPPSDLAASNRPCLLTAYSSMDSSVK